MYEPLQAMLDELCFDVGAPVQVQDAILYTLNSTRRFLEPTSYSSSLRGCEFFPISTTPEESLSGIVSHTFQTNEKRVSLRPSGDDRIGETARQATTAYRFNNSLIALPVSPIHSSESSNTPLAVLLLHTASPLDTDPQGLEYFRHAMFALAAQLQHIDAVSHREHSDRLTRLSSMFLTSIRPVLEPSAVFQRFASFCSEALGADVCFFARTGEDGTALDDPIAFCNDPECTNDLEKLMLNNTDDFHQIDSATRTAVLNYGYESSMLESSLRKMRGGKQGRWILLSKESAGGLVGLAAVCKQYREDDVWAPTDVSLLDHAFSLFLHLLGRATECQQILRSLDRAESLETNAGLSPSQFQAIAYVSREFLNMDQVMVCSVGRTEKGLRIKGRFATGFGRQGDDLIVEKTDRLLSFAEASRAPMFPVAEWDEPSTDMSGIAGNMDITALITNLCFTTATEHLPPAFRISHKQFYKHFRLDYRLAADCNIDGDILFLPCVSRREDGDSVLRGMIMLGSSSGKPELSGREPVLSNLASQIASSMASDERSFVEERLGVIGAQKNFTFSSLHCISKKTALATRAMVCRIWLRVDCAANLLKQPLQRDQLGKVFRRYLQTIARTKLWEEDLPGPQMIARFFGVAIPDVKTVGWDANEVLAGHIVDHLYFSVSRWDVIAASTKGIEAELRELFDQIAKLPVIERREPDDTAFCLAVEQVLQQCYLPGFGLTGWTLRYADGPIRSKSLSPDEITRIYTSIVNRAADRETRMVDEVLRRELPLGVASDACRNGYVVKPLVAQHVRDHDYDIRRPLDTFMCVPFGTLEPGEYPRGIVRVALSSSPAGSFDTDDEQRLAIVATHLSELLMSQTFRWERYVSKYEVGVKLQNFLSHRLKRFSRDSATVHQFLHNSGDAPDEIKLASGGIDVVARTVDRLESTRQFLRDISLVDDEDLSSQAVKEYVVHWFQSHSYGIPVLVENTTELACALPAKSLIDFCLLLDEIVFNACIHGTPKPLSFQITLAWQPCLQVRLFEILNHEANGRSPDPAEGSERYSEFLERKIRGNSRSGKRGRGANDVATWEECLGVNVLCNMERTDVRAYLIEAESLENPTTQSKESIQDGNRTV